MTPNEVLPNGNEVYLVDPVARRAEWLALRARDLTTGDIAAIVGANPHRTPLRVWAEKREMIGSVEENAIMKRGRHIERAILSWLREDRTEWTVGDAGVYLRDPVRRIGATPDFFATRPDREGTGAVDAKCIARRNFVEKWRGGDKEGPIVAPLHYQLQVNVQARLAGMKWGALAVLVLGEFSAELHVVEVEINPRAWLRVAAEAEHFWRLIEEGRQPEPVAPADFDTVGEMFPEDGPPDPPLDLTKENEWPELVSKRDEFKEAIKDAEGRVNEIDMRLKLRMGEAPVALLSDGRKVTWKQQQRKAYSVEALSFRVLRVGKAPA
jgi:putative phage-type endonuclease